MRREAAGGKPEVVLRIGERLPLDASPEDRFPPVPYAEAPIIPEVPATFGLGPMREKLEGLFASILFNRWLRASFKSELVDISMNANPSGKKLVNLHEPTEVICGSLSPSSMQYESLVSLFAPRQLTCEIPMELSPLWEKASKLLNHGNQ
jgi:hypothetical protein